MKPRPDTYDYIGMSLVALLAVMWAFHFILPPPPPEPPDPQAAAGSPLPFGATSGRPIGQPSLKGLQPGSKP